MAFQAVETRTSGVHQGVLPEPLISEDDARRRANGYLAGYVSTCYGAKDPELLQLEKPVWQLVVYFKRPHEQAFRVGFIDVDAHTGEVQSLTDEQIETIRGQARVLVRANTSQTATSS